MPARRLVPLVASLAAATLTVVSAARAEMSVPEIEVADLPDTAMAEMTSTGPVILYNPVLRREAGAAMEFVRAHEYAHVVLGHLDDEQPLSTIADQAAAEAQADCFAAKRSSPGAVRAMVRLVLGQRPSREVERVYGTRHQRAGRILACAKQRES